MIKTTTTTITTTTTTTKKKTQNGKILRQEIHLLQRTRPALMHLLLLVD